MGLAVYNSIILDLNFPLCCFKKLLSANGSGNGYIKCSLSDLSLLMPVRLNIYQKAFNMLDVDQHKRLCFTMRECCTELNTQIFIN